MRSIAMKHFRNDVAKARAIAGERVVVGQIIGEVFDVQMKEGTYNGEQTLSPLLIGDFLASNFAERERHEKAQAERLKAIQAGVTLDGKPQEPMADYKALEAGQFYAPKYFAENIQGTLKNSPNGLVFAVNILMVPNPGQSIPYMYEVEHQIKRSSKSRLFEIAEQLHANGSLAIPVKGVFQTAALSGPATVRSVEHDPETGELPSDPSEDLPDGEHDAAETMADVAKKIVVKKAKTA